MRAPTALIFVLRHAANLGATATLIRIESKKTLDVLRDEAAESLNAVCGLLEIRLLTQDVIDQASQAVGAWLSALPSDHHSSR
jgi:thiamine monophosphate synthase